MLRKMIVVSPDDGYEWCKNVGVEYIDSEISASGEFVMTYDDGTPKPMTKKEEEYYEKQFLREQKKKEREERQAKEVWIIYSDDPYYSRMYKGVGRHYTFNANEAEKLHKDEAQRKAIMMTKNSKVGRTWVALRIK